MSVAGVKMSMFDVRMSINDRMINDVRSKDPRPSTPVSLSPCLLVSLSPCLLVSLSSRLPVSLSPCLPVCQSPCLLVSLSPCLPVCLSPCLSVSLSASLPVSLSARLLVCPSPCLPVSLSPCLPVCPSPCLPVSLSSRLPVSLSPRHQKSKKSTGTASAVPVHDDIAYTTYSSVWLEIRMTDFQPVAVVLIPHQEEIILVLQCFVRGKGVRWGRWEC